MKRGKDHGSINSYYWNSCDYFSIILSLSYNERQIEEMV